jgi:phosphoribosyl 1,2-cyclic phosphodiesterase
MMADGDGLLVRFWGVRGTVPCPGRTTLVYGGNTSCVEVRCGEHRLIFDGGSGLRNLGMEMAAEDQPIRSHLFFTHTHFDHVTGLPFFKPAYDPRNCFQLWSGHLRRHGQKLADVLQTLMQAPFFPVPLEIMHARLGFHDFDAGDVLNPCDGVAVRTRPLNHPGGATGYRVEGGGRVLCYVTDTEHPERGHDKEVLKLIEGADLVIYDTTYTEEEYPRYRGWGHSTWQEGVRLCDAAGARRLVAFHHDPAHDDQAMDKIQAALTVIRDGSLVAREGLEIQL